MRLQRSYHRAAAVYVTQSEITKKAPRRIEALRPNLMGNLLDYFPFLAAFLSAFFAFFAIVISFSRLLLETVFGGTAANLQSLPLLPFYG
jgi:hypothetical protein